MPQRSPKPTAEERLSRILAMIPWIVAHDGPAVGAVCERFGCTPTELARDIELLYVCGLHPYTPDLLIEAGITDGRVFVRYADYLSRPLRLTPTEGLALVAAASTLLATPGTDPDGPLARGLAKLAGVIGSGEALDVELGSADESLLAVMREAGEHRVQVEIDYYTYSRDRTTTRTIEPASVFSSGGAWYVAAYCHLAGAQRLFRVDRILQVRPGHCERTGPELAAGPELLAPGSIGHRITLRLDPAAAWVAEQYPVESVVTGEDGGIEVSLRVEEWPWLDRVLLRLGPLATVIDAPPQWPGRGPGAARVLARYMEQA